MRPCARDLPVQLCPHRSGHDQAVLSDGSAIHNGMGRWVCAACGSRRIVELLTPADEVFAYSAGVGARAALGPGAARGGGPGDRGAYPARPGRGRPRRRAPVSRTPGRAGPQRSGHGPPTPGGAAAHATANGRPAVPARTTHDSFATGKRLIARRSRTRSGHPSAATHRAPTAPGPWWNPSWGLRRAAADPGDHER